MRNALATFTQNISDARQMTSLHEHLTHAIQSPVNFDDLLRFQVVYAVSAFDKLMHDIIRIGMVDIFTGKRASTKKFCSESISLEAYYALRRTISTSSDVQLFDLTEAQLFEQEITAKLKINSYQTPEKIADGLSYIWDIPDKWQRIADKMNLPKEVVRKQLSLVVEQRNRIAHEADINPATGAKYPIARDDCVSTLLFVEKCGQSIVDLVLWDVETHVRFCK